MNTQQQAQGGSIRVIVAAVLLITLVGVALAVSNPLLSLTLEKWGVSGTISGLTATGAGLGTVLAVPLVPRLARAIGVPGLLGLALIGSALGMAAFHYLPGVPAWAILRFLLGCGIGITFTLAEFWINAAAPPARRGIVMGLYATALYAGFAAGPVIFAALGTEGALPFLATGAIMLIGLIPLAMAGKAAPTINQTPSGSVLHFITAAPSATFGAFIFGAVETGMIIMLAVHNVRLGFSQADAALLLSAFTLGNVVFQVPIGLASDRFDRRRLLLAIAAISTILALALPVVATQFWLYAAALFLLGGISGGIYPIALAHIGARFAGSDLASANAAAVMLYSVGLMLGPPLIGFAMEQAGAAGLPLATAMMLGGYALLVLSRLRRAD